MQVIRQLIAEKLADKVSFDKTRFLSLFKIPDTADRGDLALPCFPFAKELKKKPDQIAADFVETFRDDPLFAKVEATGPFLNFTYNGVELAKRFLPEVIKQGDAYGNNADGEGKSVVIDFSSPNIAKPIAFHHIRSTVIGAALARLHEACGYKVEKINYLGDWGTQFGKLIVAYKRWGNEKELRERQIRHLLDIYVKFHQVAEEEPELEEEARGWFVKMEKGDEEALELWRLFYEISMKEFERIYSLLGIEFDRFEGESRYRDELDKIIDLVGEKAGTEISKGALVVNLDDDKLPPCLLRKADGATLYATRDIAAAIDRYERFKFTRSLYVVAQQQAVHFKQFFRVLEKMGYQWADRLTHISFGMLQLADKTMSTRKGQVIFLEDVLSRAIALAKETIESKNAALENKDDVARQVGVGAIIFGDLINRRTNDVTFEWEKILNLQGETGVYVQYTNARCRSMLRKAGEIDQSKVDFSKYTAPEEKDIIKLLSQFPDKVRFACDKFDPSIIARHLIDLCKAFNRIYNIDGYRFLDDNETLLNTRMYLAKTLTITLVRGLAILGLEAPEEM